MRATNTHFCLFVAATAAVCGIAGAAEEPAPVPDDVLAALRTEVDNFVEYHEKNVELDRAIGLEILEGRREEFEKWGRYLA